MKKRQHIQLVPGTKLKYFRIWCSYCKTVVKTCKANNGSALKQCPHIERLSYRFVGFLPGTRQRIVRSLGTNFAEAVKQVATLKQQLENGSFELDREKSKENMPAAPIQKSSDAKPELLAHIFGRYLATLRGEGVAGHLRLVRSKSHVNDVKDTFKHFLLAMQKSKVSVDGLHLPDINDTLIGYFHDHLIERKYSENTYNRKFSHLTTFALWAERENYGNIRRFFEKVPRKTVTPRPEIITAEEFSKTISAISYENGWQVGIGKRKAKRNLYREYLIPAFRFALITGRRLEELITAKFSDVTTDEKGTPQFITFTDHKVNHILHIQPGQERKLFTPAHKEIQDFLISQGYGKRSTDDFILAPELTHRRIAVMRQDLSRAFTHFFRIANPECTREVSFKTLRKTYLTNLAIHTGKDITPVSGHADTGVLKHYLNEKQLALAESLKDFSVFGKEEELKIARNKRNNDKSIER